MMSKDTQQDLEFTRLKNIWDNWSEWVFRVLNNPDPKDRVNCYGELILTLATKFGVSEPGMRLLMFEAASHYRLGGGEPLSSFVAKLNMELEIIESKKEGMQ